MNKYIISRNNNYWVGSLLLGWITVMCLNGYLLHEFYADTVMCLHGLQFTVIALEYGYVLGNVNVNYCNIRDTYGKHDFLDLGGPSGNF